jgi:prepilin-type processing-associated H-X9-DG protein
MRLTPNRKVEAFTRVELIVVLIVVAVIAATADLLLVSLARVKGRAPRISCVNNLKQIGTAYRIWENDNGDRYPASQSAAKGGWSERLTNADQGYLCWTNYYLMGNELGQSPKVIVCPSDERTPAETFTNFANTNLSYLVGVSAIDTQPQSLLGGDRNLGNGTKPDRAYGFSPENGQGNDVAIQTNSKTGPVCWSSKMHSQDDTGGGGNILLGDGSVQQVITSHLFNLNWRFIREVCT